MKKLLSIVLAVAMLGSGTVRSADLEDKKIYTSYIQKTYTGNRTNSDKIKNLQFTDVEGNFFEMEIAKMGALDVIKGTNKKFNPNDNVTNQEVLTFLVRLQGLEQDAMEVANTIRQDDNRIGSLWSIGYLNVAMNIGLIGQREYNQSRSTDQEGLDRETSFLRDAPATREDVGAWVHDLVLINNVDTFNDIQKMQKVLTFTDYENIAPDKIDKINKITSKGIMNGRTDGTFDPKGYITRGEMAKVLSNIDVQYKSLGYETKRGTVRGSRTLENKSDLIRDKAIDKYIRTSEGKVDVIRNYTYDGIEAEPRTLEVPVYRNGMKGVDSLQFGDEIEYIVDNFLNEVKYVGVLKNNIVEEMVEGKIWEVDFIRNELIIKDENEVMKKYPISDSIITENKLFMDEKFLENDKIPYGDVVKLTVVNNVVSKIEYVGAEELYEEFRGIVVENESDLGYMVVRLNDGKKKIMHYYEDEIEVEKLEYYDKEDEVGYIDQVFESAKYDAMDSSPKNIDVGDIVFIKPYKDDPKTIERISVATNYMMKYGQMKRVTHNNDITNILVEYEDGSTTLFEVSGNTPVMKNGKRISAKEIEVGDYGKLLINRAIINPGEVIESIKEIVVEGESSYIDSIEKGGFIGFNSIQGEVSLKNVQPLVVGKWGQYDDIKTYKVNKNMKIYSNGEEVSLDYVNKYGRDATTYVAVKNTSKGNEIEKLSIYTGRDILLPRDMIINSNGINKIQLANGGREVGTNKGTIVVRKGRLVDSGSVFPRDYGTVILNGYGSAVIEIVEEVKKEDKSLILTGEISGVRENESFTLTNVRKLENGKYKYVPTTMKIGINNETLIKIDGNIISIKDFKGYGDGNVINKTVYVVVTGNVATQVVEGERADTIVRGEIYSIEEGEIKIKDVTVRSEDGKNKGIREITIGVDGNTIVEGLNKFKIGNKINVRTIEVIENITDGSKIASTFIELEY